MQASYSRTIRGSSAPNKFDLPLAFRLDKCHNGCAWFLVFTGEVSCQGSYDMWRVSSGALSADELLHRLPGGWTIIVR